MLKPEITAALTGKRIFLSGGTGFFGKSILDYFTRHPVENLSFTVLARHAEEFRSRSPGLCTLSGLSFENGDVRSFRFPDGRFDFVIHAATPAVTTLAPGEMRSIVVEGTRRILDFAEQCGAGRLLLTSSGAVYGPQPPGLPLLPEEFPCRPVTEYGIAKLDAERMCADSNVFCCIARCFAFIGPWLPRTIHYAAGNFLRDCEENRPIIIQGDGRTVRSYMHADDLVEWLFTLLIAGRRGEAYNIGSEEAVTILELARRIRAHFGSSNEIRILGTPSPLPAPRYVPSTKKIRTELGLLPPRPVF